MQFSTQTFQRTSSTIQSAAGQKIFFLTGVLAQQGCAEHGRKNIFCPAASGYTALYHEKYKYL